MEQVGLPADFSLSHDLFPAHPLTLRSLESLPEGVIEAPLAFLEVTPTLSVRTVVVNQTPNVHIKVPLIMRSLGTKNIRLIKPSTLYDGHWFERLLTHLEQSDSELRMARFSTVTKSMVGTLAMIKRSLTLCANTLFTTAKTKH